MSALPAIYDLVDERTLHILERRGGANSMKRRGWLVRRALLGADLAGLCIAFVIAELTFGAGATHANRLGPAGEYLFFLAALPAWVVAAKTYRLYDRDEERTDHSTTDDFAGVFHLVTVGAFLLYVASRETRWFNPEFRKLVLFWALAVIGVSLCRVAARAFCRRRIEYLQNTLIIGAGSVGQEIARKLLKHPEYGLNLVGFVDPDPKDRIPGLEHLTLLGDMSDLRRIVELLDVERVIVAFSNEPNEALLRTIRGLSEMDVQVDIVPRFFDILHPAVDVHTVEGLPLFSLAPCRLSRSSRLIKRLVDIGAAGIGLLLLAPAFGAIALAIKVDSPGPVFFRQVRMGERQRLFRIWKFRSMGIDADDRKQELAYLNKHLAPGGDPRMFKIEDDPRVTRVGAWLRRTSIDELPQLINVLLGEMSLVGPRPLILEEMGHVDDWGFRRLDLRPGITGLWQVLGRDDIGFDEMVRLDYTYVTGWALSTDLRLVLRTIPRVVMRRAAV